MTDQQFDRRRVQRWRRDIWRTFDKCGFTPPEIMAAMVLAAVAAVGTDLGVLSELTGHSTGYVRKVLKRLRAARILSGQTLRTPGVADGMDGHVGTVLDAGVAAGIFARFPDPKRSAAQKARAPETRARGPRRPRVVVALGAVFTPNVKKADPLYGLPTWKGGRP
jgi:hypothetical protein